MMRKIFRADDLDVTFPNTQGLSSMQQAKRGMRYELYCSDLYMHSY